jgi:thiamine-phosphate diphosphorylase
VSLIAHLVTDRRRYALTPAELIARTSRAAHAGVAFIQVRERDLPDAALLDLVRGILHGAAGTPAKVLVNDRVDVALAAGAHGVHLRSDSFPASRVRAIVPAAFIIGRAVHSLDEIDRAAAGGGCDYLMFGTVFPSGGKPPGHSCAGLEGLRAACRRSPLPIIAIGGIDGARLDDVARSGAAGFAAVGMFM